MQQLNDQWFADAVNSATVTTNFKPSMLGPVNFQRAIQDCNGRTGIVFVGGNN